ncbi:MAG TPA: sugar phosphate isomerase/epimerase family protein [Armatimonadota bacterium]|nr:sugar phosphate isomerase/epimerase family protein [Armatimonadota bacterium]
MPTNRRRLLAAALGTAAPLGVAALGGAPPVAAHVDPTERRPSGGASFKLGMAAYSYRQFLQGPNKNMTLFDFIQRSAELGTDGVELTEYYFEKPITPEYLMRLKRTAHLWGQTITGTPIGNVFTHPAGPERDREIETYKRWVDISADLGSPAIRTFAGTAPKGVSEADARRNVVESLEIACDYAAKRGIFVALENHGGVVATADGLLGIVRAVKSPWLGINLDTGNFRTEDPYADLALCAPYAVTVQYKVEMFPKGGPAQPANLERIVQILRQAGYRGFVTLEYEAKEDPAVAIPRHLAEMRMHLTGQLGKVRG